MAPGRILGLFLFCDQPIMRRPIVYIFLHFFFYSLVLPCVAQPGGTSANELNLAFEHLGPEDGLDAGYNYWIKKDSYGLVWISSINGLFQFDGVNIRKYLADSGDPNSMLDNNIQSDFFEDEEGDIWFATDGGINVYQRATDDFKTIKVTDLNKDTVHQNYTIIHVDSEKVIWLKAEQNIYCYNVKDESCDFIVTTKGVSFTPLVDLTGKLQHIIACPKIGASGFECISRDEDGMFVVEDNETQIIKGGSDFYNNAIVEGDNVWLIANKGIVRFDIETGEKKVIFRSTVKSDDFKCGKFITNRSILIGSKSGLWQGDLETGTLVKRHPLSKDKLNLGVSEIYIDQDDQIWLSYFKQSGVGVSWLYNYSFDKLLSDKDKNEVTSISEISKDRIWVLLNDDKIAVFDHVGNKIRIDTSLCVMETSATKRLVSDSKGGVYVNVDQSIYQYSFEKNIWEHVYQFESRIIYFDFYRKGGLIVNTLDGVYKLSDANPWQVQKITDNPSVSNTFYFFIDSTFLFLPEKGKKILIYNLSTPGPRLENQLSIDFDVYDISRSGKEGSYWVGTDNGLKILQWSGGEGGEIKAVNHAVLSPGLIANVIEDQSGNLWLTDSRGMIRIENQLKDGILFTHKNGLPSEHFSLFYSKYLDSRSGAIWLGTDNGLLMFFPSKIKILTTDHYPVMEEFKVNGNQFAFEGDSFELSYAENTISFFLKSIGTPLLAPYKVFCKLNHYDEEWQEYDPSQLIRYNKLPPGEYRLQFFVQNASLLNSKINRIDFSIRPPFWQEAWFLILSGIGLVSLVFLSVKIYFEQKIKTQQRIIEKQLMLQEERNRIAGELHDDLGVGLSTIKFLSEKVVMGNLGKEDAAISRINNAAAQLLEKMSTIIWAVNSQNDSLESLVAYLYSFAYNYSETHSIQLEIEALPKIPAIEISGEKRRHVYLIVQESFHNIIKHAKASKIKMHIEIDAEVLEIFIKDNGQGFLSEENSKGNGLRNIKDRAHKLNGTISIKDNKGLEVLCRIPLAQQRL